MVRRPTPTHSARSVHAAAVCDASVLAEKWTETQSLQEAATVLRQLQAATLTPLGGPASLPSPHPRVLGGSHPSTHTHAPTQLLQVLVTSASAIQGIVGACSYSVFSTLNLLHGAKDKQPFLPGGFQEWAALLDEWSCCRVEVPCRTFTPLSTLLLLSLLLLIHLAAPRSCCCHNLPHTYLAADAPHSVSPARLLRPAEGLPGWMRWHAAFAPAHKPFRLHVQHALPRHPALPGIQRE